MAPLGFCQIEEDCIDMNDGSPLNCEINKKGDCDDPSARSLTIKKVCDPNGDNCTVSTERKNNETTTNSSEENEVKNDDKYFDSEVTTSNVFGEQRMKESAVAFGATMGVFLFLSLVCFGIHYMNKSSYPNVEDDANISLGFAIVFLILSIIFMIAFISVKTSENKSETNSSVDSN